MAGLRPIFPAYSQQPSQQQMSAVLYGLNLTDLGFAVPVTVTTVADSDSSLLVLPGVNSFMAMVSSSAGAGTMTISWVHCDPDTGAVLFARQIAAGLGSGGDQVVTFGAFGVTTATLGGDVFHSGKLRMRAAGANITVNNVRLWACKR